MVLSKILETCDMCRKQVPLPIGKVKEKRVPRHEPIAENPKRYGDTDWKEGPNRHTAQWLKFGEYYWVNSKILQGYFEI